METIEDLIRQTETAVNEGNAESLAETFTEDAWSVGVTGQVLHGRDEILETSRQLLAGPLRDLFARYLIDEVRHVAPDVAIVRKLAYATDQDGNDLDADHAMVALYVLVRRSNEWRVLARQNTLVQR